MIVTLLIIAYSTRERNFKLGVTTYRPTLPLTSNLTKRITSLCLDPSSQFLTSSLGPKLWFLAFWRGPQRSFLCFIVPNLVTLNAVAPKSRLLGITLALAINVSMLPTPLRELPESPPILLDVVLTSLLKLPQWNADDVFDSFVVRVRHLVWLSCSNNGSG
jgi:hypothetical protein